MFFKDNFSPCDLWFWLYMSIYVYIECSACEKNANLLGCVHVCGKHVIFLSRPLLKVCYYACYRLFQFCT